MRKSHTEKDDELSKSKSEITNLLEKCKINNRNRMIYSPETTMVFKKLPTLADAKKTNLEHLLKEKLHLCCIVFDFSRFERTEEKERKEKTLIELSEFVRHIQFPIPDYIYSQVCHMVGCNIFRTLAPFHPIMSVGIEEEEDFQLNEAWPHLQYVYEIMLRLLENPAFEVKRARPHIDHTFVKYFLELFDSADPRERDYLKTILHRIYGKIISLRAFIRKHINHIFFTFIYETERFNGIAELLEILGSIINGFQVPLKDEHRSFLKHVLLPLHKTKCLNQYHPQLAYCVTEFLKKDHSLITYVIIDGLIKFWPKMHSFKELMFLNELEECLELCDKVQFKRILRPLFLQLSKCVSSSNFQVCERTLYLWTNVEIIDLMTPNLGEILPLVFPALYNSKQHWNKQIHSMVFNALKVMMEMNQRVFDEYTLQFKDCRTKEKQQIENQTEMWNKMYLKAKKNPLFSKYSSSILTNLTRDSVGDEMQKNLKEIEAELQTNLADPALFKKQMISRHPSTVSIKSIDTKLSPKNSYSFKN